MIIAILSGDNKLGWPGEKLIQEIKSAGHKPQLINMSQMSACISDRHTFHFKGEEAEFDGGVIRGLGSASTDEITYRISLLEHINYDRKILINEPYAFRRAKDKYAALFHLSKSEIPVPKTFVTEDADQAYKIAEEWRDIVIKPLIGSRGLGPIRSNNADLSYRIIKTLRRLNQVIYIQEYVPKPDRDIRVFVVGEDVIGGIFREVEPGKWKTNIAVGAKARKMILDDELEELSIKVAKILNLDYTGIDILETTDGYKVIEANAAPSWSAMDKALNTNTAKSILEHLLAKIKK